MARNDAHNSGNGRWDYDPGERSVESVTQRSRQAGNVYDSFIQPDFPRLKVKEGDGEYRILPPTWEDKKRWGKFWDIPVFVHFGIGTDGGSFLCMEKMTGEPCAVCEARARTRSEDDLEALRISSRRIAWAIDRKDERAGPQVWDMAPSLFKEINDRSVNKRTNAVVLIEEPYDGYDIYINRKGTDYRTKYSVDIARDPSDIHPDDRVMAQWEAYVKAHPLPDVLMYHDFDYVHQVLTGQTEDDGEPVSLRTRQGGGGRDRPRDDRGGDDRGRRGDDRRDGRRDDDRGRGREEPDRRSARDDREPERGGRRTGRADDPPARDEPDRRSERSGGRLDRDASRGSEPERGSTSRPSRDEPDRRSAREEPERPAPADDQTRPIERRRLSDARGSEDARQGSARSGEEPDTSPSGQARSGLAAMKERHTRR